MGITSTAHRRELGDQLRAMRTAAGLTVAQLAHETGWNTTRVSRVECGQIRTSAVDVIHYVGACGEVLTMTSPLLALARQAERKLGYWLSPRGEWLRNSLHALIYHESTADRSTSYDPMVIPGLLQTADYARVWISREGEGHTSDEIDGMVRRRMDRQRILHRPHPARFTFFVHEQALRLEVGSAAVMHEQLLNLVLISSQPHVTLRVVPATACELVMLGGPFRLFEYDKHPPLVYLDGPRSGVFIEDRDYVADYRELLPALDAAAFGAGESRTFAANLADAYDRGSLPDADRPVEEEQL